MNYDKFLELFTSNDPIREQLQVPCANGAVVFATNGKVAIKVPKDSCLSQYNIIDKYPDIQKIFDEAIESNPVPKTIAINKLRALYKNFNRVPKYALCVECNGTGNCICPNCDDEHDCGHCDDGYTEERIGIEIDFNENFLLGAAVFKAVDFEPVYSVCDSLNSDLQILGNLPTGVTIIRCSDIEMLAMPLKSECSTDCAKLEFD